jgi:hypothetical protein
LEVVQALVGPAILLFALFLTESFIRSSLTAPALISEIVITELQSNLRFPIPKFFGFAKPPYGVTDGGKVGYVPQLNRFFFFFFR